MNAPLIIAENFTKNTLFKKKKRYVIVLEQAFERSFIMEYTYRTRGTCSRAIHFEVEDGKVKNVRFDGGCNGNLQGIGRLVESDSISLLEI